MLATFILSYWITNVDDKFSKNETPWVSCCNIRLWKSSGVSAVYWLRGGCWEMRVAVMFWHMCGGGGGDTPGSESQDGQYSGQVRAWVATSHLPHRSSSLASVHSQRWKHKEIFSYRDRQTETGWEDLSTRRKVWPRSGRTWKITRNNWRKESQAPLVQRLPSPAVPKQTRKDWSSWNAAPTKSFLLSKVNSRIFAGGTLSLV